MNKYYCEVEKTGEVYEARYETVILSIMHEDDNMNRKQAEEILEATTIDNPYKFKWIDEVCWKE